MRKITAITYNEVLVPSINAVTNLIEDGFTRDSNDLAEIRVHLLLIAKCIRG